MGHLPPPSRCVVDFYRLFSTNLGVSKYLTSSSLRIPYGWGEEPDKRRGGRWYLGIQALEEPAEYAFVTSHQAPEAVVNERCSRFDPFCAYADRYRDVEMSAASRPRRAESAVVLYSALLCSLTTALVVRARLS